MTAQVPARGEIILIDFEPNAGQEIGKRRPAIVMSHKQYNRRVGLVVVCPVTTKVSGYPFEVSIHSSKIAGAALADRFQTFDWRARNSQRVDRVTESVLSEILGKFTALVGPLSDALQ